MFAYTSFHINNSYRETIKLKSLGRICNKRGNGRIKLRVDNDGEDRSRRPDVTAQPCVDTGKAFEGSAGPPSRAWRVSRTRVGGTVSRT
jgi:hypothetical protein